MIINYYLLTGILYHDRKEIDISEERKRYESDKVLVEKIASYYRLREILLFDDENEDKNHGYDYWEYKGSGDHLHKFLATAMEALLGAYYLDHNESIKEVEPVARMYERICSRSKKQVALMAAANKMLDVIFSVLSNDRPFRC